MVAWDQAGVERLRAEPVDGKWYDGGRAVQAAGKITDGMMAGEWTLTRVGGVKVAKDRYKGGVSDGPFQRWHATGSLQTEGTFKGGVYHGTLIDWDEQGRLLAVACYDGGKKVWTSFEPVDSKVTCP